MAATSDKAETGGQVGTAELWYPPVRLGRQYVHNRPCFTQTQDLHIPRPLHWQHTIICGLETLDVDDSQKPPEVSFVSEVSFLRIGLLFWWRSGDRRRVGGRHLLVRLPACGDIWLAIFLCPNCLCLISTCTVTYFYSMFFG